MSFENPWVHGIVLGMIIANVALGITGYSIWFERKFAGRMQNRPGPTEVGPWGLLQPIADVLKLLQKEDIVPRSADKALFNLAPPLTVFAVIGTMAVLPVAPGWIIADLEIGVLFALAMASLLVFPVWMAGWASNNKYALLGGMRSAAQSISYEIPLLLSATVPIILADSFRIGDIVEAQLGGNLFAFWPPGPGALAFILFFLCSLAESNRIPFDIPEAESELVAGVTTEYTGMKFGLFYLAEYLHTLIISAMAAAMFLGGCDGPGANDGFIWMLIKTLVLFISIFWIRWSYMRFRSDQLMAICWKLFLPLGLFLVMASALWVHWT
ncbi:MAG: NADH-quinone oxidoreductase subunit NuoH [Deltaproteobacteria bacterium]|nr:NADH-quinone oxidoreductase subunit NuoH [Deltaproteobacteria bacterium]